MTTPTDREQRIEEFKRLFALLPGPQKVDRIRQAQAAMDLPRENYIRRCIMDVPDRVPSWRSIRMLQKAIGEKADA